MEEKKILTYEELMSLFAEIGRKIEQSSEKHDREMAQLREQQKEHEKEMAESRKEHDRRMAEHEKEMAQSRKEHDERMERSRKEHEKRMAEHEKRMERSRKEHDRRMAEHEKEMAQSRERHKEIDKLQKETAEQMKKTDEKLDRLAKNVGGINDNIGHHAEQYFQNVFDNSLSFGGQKYDYMRPNLKYGRKGVSAEFDIVLVNGESVAVIEAKSRIHPKFIKELAEEKVAQFRKYYPEYKNYKLYLGAAGFSFDGSVIEEAKKYGIGVVRQVGESLEITDKDLKCY